MTNKKKESTITLIINSGIILIFIVLFGLLLYKEGISNVENCPSSPINITGKNIKVPGSVFPHCYYQGRQYGCLRNLPERIPEAECK